MKNVKDIVSRVITISSLSLTPLLTGCVTNSDYNGLETRYKETKQELRIKDSQVVYHKALNYELKKELDEVKGKYNKLNEEIFNYQNVDKITKENSLFLMFYNMIEEGRENQIPYLIEDNKTKIYALIVNGDKEEAKEELLRNIQRTSDMLKKLVAADDKYGDEELHLYPFIKTEAYKQIEESDKILEK